MSKERLEEIKMLWEQNNDVCFPDDYEWLIKQAERVQELEEKLHGNNIRTGYKRMYGECNRDYAKLLQQNNRYRERVAQLINYIEMTGDETHRQVHKIHVILDGLLEGKE